jgi:PleD family two-component response regulator
VLKEFARRLKEASRGSDYAVRLGNEDFVLVLPKCNLGEVTRILKRVGPLEMNCAGKKISLICTTGWVDYQPGDMPGDLLKRATQLLHLYGNAAQDAYTSTLATR